MKKPQPTSAGYARVEALFTALPVQLIRTSLLLLMVLWQFNALAQSPQAIPYQAIARDSNGSVLSNQVIGLRFTIIDSNVNSVDYQETQTVTTNALGLFTANIGQGTPIVNLPLNINWAISGNEHLKVEMDPAGGTNYIDMGTTRFLSVPFALYANSSGDNHWSANGSDIYNNNPGKVGIGLNTPAARLHIQRDDFGQEAILGDDVFPNTNDAVIRLQLGNATGNSFARMGESMNSFLSVGWRYNPDPALSFGQITTTSPLLPLRIQNLGGNTAIGFDSSLPQHKVSIGSATNDTQPLTLRTFSNDPPYWKGGAAFGYNQNAVIMGELAGVATLGGHNADLSNWSNLAINPGGGNVGVGTAAPAGRLHINNDNTADELVVGENLWNLNDFSARINLGSTTNSSLMRIGQSASNFLSVGWFPNFADPTLGVGQVATFDSVNSLILQRFGGKVGVGPNLTPQHKFSIGDLTTDLQPVTLRVYTNDPANWKGGAAFGYTLASVIMGELNGVASISGQTGDLGSAASLSINPQGGNVGVGTTLPAGRLHIVNDNAADEMVVGENLWNTNDFAARINLGSTTSSSFLRIGQSASNFMSVGWFPNFVDPTLGIAQVATFDPVNSLILQRFGGKVGVGPNLTPQHKFSIGDLTSDTQPVTFRVYTNDPTNWKGGAAFGYNVASVIMGELGGVASISGHSADLSSYANLSINPGGGNVGVGTATPVARLDVNGNVNAAGGTGNGLWINNEKAITNDMSGRTEFFHGNVEHMEFNGSNTDFSNTPVYVEQKLGVGLDPSTQSIDAKLHVNGDFKLTDGSQGAGKVLTSDANGNASWQTPSASGSTISTYFNSGLGSAPGGAMAFIGPTVTVTITSPSQKIVVNVSKVLGTFTAGGASGLGLYPGYKLNTATSPTVVGPGMIGLTCAQNQRQIFAINGLITGLAPGTYEVGMAGYSINPLSWNNNDYGYISVLVIQ